MTDPDSASMSDTASMADTAPMADAGVPTCDLTMPFGTATLVPGIATTTMDAGKIGTTEATLTSDELQIIFGTNVQDRATSDFDLFIAKRADRDAGFMAPTPLGTLNNTSNQRGPSLSGDGLTLYFHQSVSNNYDIYRTTRGNVTDTTFPVPAALTTVNTAGTDVSPNITVDGTALYFVREAPSHIFRALASNAFATPSQITELDTVGGVGAPIPTADDLNLYYANVVGGMTQVWFANRTATNGAYTSFSPVSELSVKNERPTWISRNGCRLYFSSERNGSGPNEAQLFFADKP